MTRYKAGLCTFETFGEALSLAGQISQYSGDQVTVIEVQPDGSAQVMATVKLAKIGTQLDMNLADGGQTDMEL